MEEQVNPIKVKYKFAADYGLILGGYIAFFYCLQLLFPTNMFVGLLNTAGFFGTPFVCYQLVKRYRDKGNNGFISFGQAWSFGIWLFLFAGLIMAVVYFVHLQWLDPNYLNNIFNQTLEALDKMNYDRQLMDKLADMTMPTPIQIVVTYLFFYIIGGAILFLLVSGFVVKKDPNAGWPGKNSDGTPYKPYGDNSSSSTNSTNENA
jgi:hypothetical protein